MTNQQEFRKLTEEAKFEAFGEMCEKVADLEKENAELKEKWLRATDEGTSWAHLKNLENENAELKARVEKQDSDILFLKHLTESQRTQIEVLGDQIPWKDIKDKSDVIGKLTKAKEYIGLLLMNCISIYERTGKTESEIQKEAEQFLQNDIDNAIQKANEGLDLDKIADEIEKDIKEQIIKE